MTSAHATVPCSSLLAASIPGRLRLRDPCLHAPACADAIASTLRAIPGVRTVESNLQAGSLRVLYADADRAMMEARVLAAVAPFLPSRHDDSRTPSDAPARERRSSDRRRAGREWNRVAKLGMLASLPVSLALAAGGAKKLHALTGGVFSALLLVHLAVHRRHLIK